MKKKVLPGFQEKKPVSKPMVVDGQSYELGANGNFVSKETGAEHILRGEKMYELIGDSAAYANSLKEAGAKSVYAEKSQGVLARKVKAGERIDVYSQNGQLEAPEIGREGCYLLTKAGLDGKAIVDDYGHVNAWQAEESVFRKKYDVPEGDLKGETFVKAKGGKQEFLQTMKDIALMVPWGDNGSLIPLTVDKGGYMNVTNPTDIYGISERDFKDTYSVMPVAGKQAGHGKSDVSRMLENCFNDESYGGASYGESQVALGE